MARRTVLAAALLSFSSLCWAGNVVLARAVHAEIPPVALSFWRWLVALLILASWSWPLIRRNWPVVRREWRRLLRLALVGMAIFHTTLYLAVNYTTAVNVALIMAATPLVVPLFSWAIRGERLSARLALGTAVSLIGVLVVVTRADWQVVAAFRFNAGDLIVLASMTAWSLYTVLVRDRPPDLHPRAQLVATMGFAVALILPLYLLESFAWRAIPVAAESFAVIGYVAIFASVLAFLAFNRGIEIIGPNLGGLFIHLIPIFATLLAVVFLGEDLRTYHAVGIATIALGILIATGPSVVGGGPVQGKQR